jgi:hypothetical protein
MMEEIIERTISGKTVEIEITDTNIRIRWNKSSTETDFVSINPNEDCRDITVNTNQSVLFDKLREGIYGFEVKRLVELKKAIRQKKKSEEVISEFQKEL